MATRQQLDKHAQHLMEVNPNYTKEEALNIALFDLEYTNSDAKCREFLEDQVRDCDVSLEEAKAMTTKERGNKTKKRQAQANERRANTLALNAKAEERVGYLISELSKRTELFGNGLSYSISSITGVAPESGLPYTIKISKHKEQKVFTKFMPRKKTAKDITMAEQRAMALGFILATAPTDMFEALSFSSSSFGFVNRDTKFCYGSIKITQHKRAK